jgi:hypothetical protein
MWDETTARAWSNARVAGSMPRIGADHSVEGPSHFSANILHQMTTAR